jgi:hypothetical protein
MAEHLLLDEVGVLVEAEAVRRDRERAKAFARRQSAQVRHPDLDDEAPTRFEVSGGVGEAGDLIVLRGQVHDRVEQQIDEPKGARYPFGGEVADRRAHAVGAGLGAQPIDHRRRQVDALHGNTAFAQRQRDPSGADAELEGGAVAGERGEEVDSRSNDPWGEHVGAPLVVSRRDRLVEVVHLHTLTLAPPATAGRLGIAGAREWRRVRRPRPCRDDGSCR